MTATQTRPIWQMTRDQYQGTTGVHRPYIAEISPWQYSSMGKQAKRQYDAKRRREWDASAAVGDAYHRLLAEAYERGEFKPDDPGVTSEARSAIFHHEQAKKKVEFDRKMVVARRENQITEQTDLRVGDRVFTLLGGFYTTVKKVNRKSVRIESRFKGNNVIDGRTYSDADYTTDKGALQWLHYTELVKAVENDTPIRPQREQVSAA